MKKFLTALLSLICVACMLGLVACEHSHTFATEWTTDSTHHWHAATCEHTTETDGKAEHVLEWKVDVEATEEATGKQHQECTVCGYKTDLDTEIPKTAHEHTFSGEWSKDATGHWYSATCSHTSEIKDKAGHSYNANSVCTVCGYAKYKVEENAFSAAVLLENVTNFSYNRDVEATQVSKTKTNQNIPAVEAEGREEFIATATRGYQRSYTTDGTQDNNIIYVIWGNNTPEQTIDLPIEHDDTNYFSVEGGREYVYDYEPIDANSYSWVKYNFADKYWGGVTYSSYIYSELSMFQEAARRFSAFTYDEQTKTYKNTQPMTFTEVDDVAPEHGITTVTFFNMYYEFKISDGVVEWMQLTLDYSSTTIYDFDTYPEDKIFVYYNGQLQGQLTEDTQVGSMTVRYYDINNSQVESLPSEYRLDPNMSDYWCDHSTLREVEALQSTHRQCCEECNAMVIWEVHHFEDGECEVCGAQCPHQNVYDGYASAVDDEYHGCFCMDCGGTVLIEHDYDGERFCADCGHTYCGHTEVFTAYDNERHYFNCGECGLTITKNHNYVEGVCSDCDRVFCEHNNLAENVSQINPDSHFIQCEDCPDMLEEAHSFVDDVCTVCEYEICTHENILNDTMYVYGNYHSYTCEDCHTEFNEGHTLVDGVCSACGYDENCEHTDTELIANDAFHISVCHDCNFTISQDEHDYENGVCQDCEHECSHQNIYTEHASAVDDEYHGCYCMDCGETILIEHDYDGERFCADCGHTYCGHTEVFTAVDNERHYFNCIECGVYITRNHNYVEGVCADCDRVFCEHNNLAENVSHTNPDSHFIQCENCPDMLEEAHSFVGNVCTVCEYERCLHQNVYNDFMYVFDNYHAYVCEDCEEIVEVEHSLADGVCLVCGYDENCEHTNTELIAEDDALHVVACQACHFAVQETLHDYENGVCQGCEHECSHIYHGETLCFYCRQECEHEYYEGYCIHCYMAQSNA